MLAERLIRGKPNFAAIPGVYNLHRDNLPNLLRAMRRTKQGLADTIIECMGHSNTLGYGAYVSGTTDGADGAYPASWPVRTAAGLASSLGLINPVSRLGQGTLSGQFDDYMTPLVSRFVDGGGTTAWNATPTTAVGGNSIFANTTNDILSTATMTCPDVVDTVDICFVKTGGALGSFTWSVDGGAFDGTGVSTAGGSGGVFRQTVSLGSAAANHTVTVKKTNASTAAVYITAFIFYNSTAPGIRFYQAGWGGTYSDTWMSTAAGAYDIGNQFAAQGQHATCIQLDLNDASLRPTTYATTMANYATIVRRCRAAQNDPIFVLSHIAGSGPSVVYTNAQQRMYRQAIMAFARSYGIPVIDLAHYYPDYTTFNATGRLQDALHPDVTGYQWQVDTFFLPFFEACWRAA